MFKLQYIIHGFYPFELGIFDNVQEAVKAIKDHVRVNSAITNPHYAKSMSGDSIMIDYGAKDCYYTITSVKEMG